MLTMKNDMHQFVPDLFQDNSGKCSAFIDIQNKLIKVPQFDNCVALSTSGSSNNGSGMSLMLCWLALGNLLLVLACLAQP